MTEQKPIMRASDIRRAVSEWVAQGFCVTVEPAGRITVQPATLPDTRDAFDLVDMRR